MKEEDMLLSLNDYNTPRVVKDLELLNLKIIRLLLLEPGTYPDQPTRGFGLQSKYRYMVFDDNTIMQFQSELNRCISEWLPSNIDLNVYVELNNKELSIGISIGNVLFEYSYDGTNLKEVTLNDIKNGEGNYSGSIST